MVSAFCILFICELDHLHLFFFFLLFSKCHQWKGSYHASNVEYKGKSFQQKNFNNGSISIPEFECECFIKCNVSLILIIPNIISIISHYPLFYLFIICRLFHLFIRSYSTLLDASFCMTILWDSGSYVSYCIQLFQRGINGIWMIQMYR